MLYNDIGSPHTRFDPTIRNDRPKLISGIWRRSTGLITPFEQKLRCTLDASVAAINAAPVEHTYTLVKRGLVTLAVIAILTSAIAPAYAWGHGGSSHHSGHRGR